jgi:hypothetical protein
VEPVIRRSYLLPLLLSVAWLGSAASSRAGEPLGRFVRVIPRVLGSLPGGEPEAKQEKQPVENGLLVETLDTSAARIALGTARAEGAVTIGPASRFQILAETMQEAMGQRFNLKIEWGKFLLQFVSSRRRSSDPEIRRLEAALGAAPGKVVVTTPNGTEIELQGTEVYVFVDRESGAASVYVLEGSVVIRREGQKRKSRSVDAGQWSYVPPVGEPTLPSPFVLWAGRQPPAQPVATGLTILDDPFLNGRDPRLGLDLPR